MHKIKILTSSYVSQVYLIKVSSKITITILVHTHFINCPVNMVSFSKLNLCPVGYLHIDTHSYTTLLM